MSNKQSQTIERLFNNAELCTRCGRPHTLANSYHSRLRGYLCVCGHDEWALPGQEIPKPKRKVNKWQRF